MRNEIHDGTFFLSSSLLAHSSLSPPLIFCIENLGTKWSRLTWHAHATSDFSQTNNCSRFSFTCLQYFFNLFLVSRIIRARLMLFWWGCLCAHCLLTLIYFINVPLIEMAARGKERRGEGACWKWLHVIDAHHRGEEEIPLEIRRRRVIWADQRHSRRLFQDPLEDVQGSWNVLFLYSHPKCHTLRESSGSRLTWLAPISYSFFLLRIPKLFFFF